MHIVRSSFFDINKLICILFVHLSSIILKNFKDHILIITEILEFIELHTYKFGLVYITSNCMITVAKPVTCTLGTRTDYNQLLHFTIDSRNRKTQTN